MKTLGHVVSVEVRKTLSIIIFRISFAVLNLSQIYFFVFYDAIMELEHPFLLAEASHDESWQFLGVYIWHYVQVGKCTIKIARN